VIEELFHEDNSLSMDVDPNLPDMTKYWGPDFFVDEVTLPSGTNRLKLNYFVKQVCDDSRYIVPFVKNIEMLM